MSVSAPPGSRSCGSTGPRPAARPRRCRSRLPPPPDSSGSSCPPLITNPVDRTLVNLPTWFWIEGGQAEQVGSSAFGLRAIATIASLHIDTGDGNGIDCPWTTTRAQAEKDCTHTYMRASNDGTATVDGQPAYTVTATSTWDVRFELNGVRVEIPGAPTTLAGPPSTATLRVAESQAVVSDAQ